MSLSMADNGGEATLANALNLIQSQPVLAGVAPATLYADGTVVRLVATDSDSDGDQVAAQLSITDLAPTEDEFEDGVSA